jgi:hypothetical protein
VCVALQLSCFEAVSNEQRILGTAQCALRSGTAVIRALSLRLFEPIYGYLKPVLSCIHTTVLAGIIECYADRQT